MAFFSRMVVLAKTETTYATDAEPTNTANAILMQDVDWTPMEADQVERPMVLPWFGNRPVYLVSRRTRLQGAVDLAGRGTAGAVPGWGPMLRACGMAEAIVADTHVDYTPISAVGDAASLYHYADGRVQAGLGARGTFTLDIQGGAIPRFRFDLQGLYVAPTAVALPTPTLTAFRQPLPVTQANTPVATLAGNNLNLRSFTYTHGNQMQLRDLPNARAVRITGRAPTATLTIEDPPALDPNWFSPIGELRSFDLTHGTQAGNIIELQLAQCRLLNPRYSDEGNTRMLTLDLRPEPSSAGNDEIRIRVK